MPLMTYVYVLSSEAWLRDRHMPLTPRERDILTRMAAAQAALDRGEANDAAYNLDELTYAKGGGWWYGLERLSARVALSLVYRAYVTREVGQNDADDYRVYVINEDGRNAAQGKPPAEPESPAPMGGRHPRTPHRSRPTP